MSDGSAPRPATETGATGNGARPEPPVLPPHRRAVPVGLVVAAVIVALDQLTKELVQAVLEPGRFVSWLGPHIGWQLVFNPGGAFGIPAPHWLFLLVTVGVVVLVGRVLPRTPTLLSAAAYGLLLGGAIGNVLDRLFKPGGEGFGTGYVVDFVAWGSFPRFNVADSAITVGFVLLVIALLLEERRAEAALADAAGEDPTGEGATGTDPTGEGATGADQTGADPDPGPPDDRSTPPPDTTPPDGPVTGPGRSPQTPDASDRDGEPGRADPTDADGAAGERGPGT